MSSNCYIVWDDEIHRCIIIDPASEFSTREIEFIYNQQLTLDYIILTHEHTDHTWGVNALLSKFNAKVISTNECKNNLPNAGNAYFKLYYERDNYSYQVRRVDITAEQLAWNLVWGDHTIKLIDTKGHSMGSMCIDIDNMLFSGDTIMQYKPYINKHNGSKKLYQESVDLILSLYHGDTMIYPGHGKPFLLKDR